MKFQKERVFTALNADELKIGSKVIVANTIGNLKELVEQNMAEGTLGFRLRIRKILRSVY